MSKEVSSQIRKLYFKQKGLETKKRLGKGIFALVLGILAVILSDALLNDEIDS